MLLQLTAQNFGPFESVLIDFGRVNCVVGRNGIGKSALLNAISWCVSGSARRGDGGSEREDDLIRIGSDQVQVSVLIDCGGEGVEIIRARKRGRSSDLVVRCGEDEWTGKSAQAEIWERIGVSGTAYREIVHVSQGRVSRIADVGDGERREILLSWMGDAIQIWDGGRDTISAQRRVARREVVKLRSHISLLSEQLAEARIQTEGDRNDSILTPDEIGAKIMALNQTLSADDVTRRDVRNRAEKIQRLEQDLTCLRSDTISADVPVPDRIDTSDTQNRLSILSEKQASIKRVGINGGWVGNCPLVGSRCPSQQWVIDSNTQRQAEIDRLDSQIRPLQQVVKDGRVRDDARKLAIARNTDLARKRVVASTEIKALEKRLDQLRSEPVPEMMSSQRRSEIQVEIDALKTRYDEIIIHARHQAEIQALEARHGSTQTELRRCEQELRICTDVLAVIGETTGPAALAEARIQDYVNTILEPIGWKLSLEWQKPTTKRVTECDGCGEICRTSRKTCPGCGENRAVVMSPDLRLVLDDGRTVRDIRHASGGQKQLVSLALRLATSPIPLLILDEVDSAVGPPLDSAVAAMVATHPIQTVVISHGDEIPALADVVIRVVESESGVSELEVSRRV